MRDIRIRDSLPNTLGRIFRRMVRIHNKALKQHSLSAIQAQILSVLWIEGSMTIGELQRALALRSSTLTGNVDRMEKAGLLQRDPHPKDRRVTHIRAIKRADEDAVLQTLFDTEERCFENWTAEERRLFLKLLKKADESFGKADS